MLKQNFVWHVFLPRGKTRLFIPDVHTGRWSEKLAALEREMQYCYSWKTFIVLHLAVHMESDIVVSRTKKSKREKFKLWLLSHLHSADQPQREVGLCVGLLVSKGYRNDRTQVPPVHHWKGVGGRGFPKQIDHLTSTSEEAYWQLYCPLCHTETAN